MPDVNNNEKEQTLDNNSEVSSTNDNIAKEEESAKNTLIKSTGATSMSQFVSFKTSSECEIIASRDGVIVSADGNTVVIKYSETDVVEYHGLTSINSEVKKGAANPGMDSSMVKKYTVLGKVNGILTVKYLKNGKLEDPKLLWPNLRAKESTNVSLGKQISEGENLAQDIAISKDNVIIGGNMDGTYDMDDVSNYIWKTTDSTSLDPGNNEKSDNNPENNSDTANEESDNQSPTDNNIPASTDVNNKIDGGPRVSNYTLPFDANKLPDASTYNRISIRHMSGIDDMVMSKVVDYYEKDNGHLSAHYVVKADGTIFSGIPLGKSGTDGVNAITILFSADYDKRNLSVIALDKVSQLIGALCNKYNFDPSANTISFNGGSNITAKSSLILEQAQSQYNKLKP